MTTKELKQQQKYTFHVHGMHCNACVLMTESELGDLPNITHVKTSLKNHSVEDELEKVRTSKVSSNKRQNPTNCEVSSLGLAWESSFRTFEWYRAFPDPGVAMRQIDQLLALV